MSDLTLIELNDEQAIEACWNELLHIRQQIDADQSEIARLQAETRVMLTELKARVGI